MSANALIQGFWIAVIVIGGAMTAFGEAESADLWFYLGGWICIGGFIGWLKTYTMDGWIGRSPKGIAEDLERAEKALRTGESLGEPLTDGQKQNLKQVRDRYARQLSKAKQLGH